MIYQHAWHCAERRRRPYFWLPGSKSMPQSHPINQDRWWPAGTTPSAYRKAFFKKKSKGRRAQAAEPLLPAIAAEGLEKAEAHQSVHQSDMRGFAQSGNMKVPTKPPGLFLVSSIELLRIDSRRATLDESVATVPPIPSSSSIPLVSPGGHSESCVDAVQSGAALVREADQISSPGHPSERCGKELFKIIIITITPA